MSTAPSPTAPAPDAEPSDPDLSGTIFAFTPVPMDRVRANGWTPQSSCGGPNRGGRVVNFVNFAFWRSGATARWLCATILPVPGGHGGVADGPLAGQLAPQGSDGLHWRGRATGVQCRTKPLRHRFATPPPHVDCAATGRNSPPTPALLTVRVEPFDWLASQPLRINFGAALRSRDTHRHGAMMRGRDRAGRA